MATNRTAIFWIRNDFRLNDNLALIEATKYDNILPLFIWNEKDQNTWKTGAASKWWLHHTILRFQESLRKIGSHLILSQGPPEEQLLKIAQTVKASDILYNNNYDPFNLRIEKKIHRILASKGIGMRSFDGSLLCSIDSLLKKDGSPYLVYTPFWKNFLKKYQPISFPKPEKLPPLPKKAKQFSCDIDSFGFLPSQDWHKSFHQYWPVGEDAAEIKLRNFIADSIKSYNIRRDLPAKEGTSMLSPHFHFGEIHPQKVLYNIYQNFGELSAIRDPNIVQFCKEILWREFSYHLLYHFPKTPNQPLREAFKKFPWKKNKKLFDAWCRGRTGYPIVDAGMRQLWTMGWMHNRVRMITASFLVKHLGLPWQEGARWFWDTLVDADLASNTQGWQWTAGCGADAAPFFRIFNPIIQGEKFDPEGHYAAEWCPELAQIPPKWIYRPWEAPDHILRDAGITLGSDYPLPIVDHKEARDQALWNYDRMKDPKTIMP